NSCQSPRTDGHHRSYAQVAERAVLRRRMALCSFDRDLLARLRRVDHRTPAERPLRTLRARRNTYRLVNQIEQEEGMDASLESLSARVQRLEDLEAIRTTWRDYCMRLDSGDWPALGDVFTEDAVLEMDGLNALSSGLDGEYRGRKSIINKIGR